MAIVINADSQTVVILDRQDPADRNTLSLLSSNAAARPAPTAPAPRDYAAAMHLVEQEVYQTI